MILIVPGDSKTNLFGTIHVAYFLLSLLEKLSLPKCVFTIITEKKSFVYLALLGKHTLCNTVKYFKLKLRTAITWEQI